MRFKKAFSTGVADSQHALRSQIINSNYKDSHKYVTFLAKRKVKMAGYWPSSVL